MQADLFGSMALAAPPSMPSLLAPIPSMPAGLTGRYPKRITRSRKRGARVPKGVAWCGRGTSLANPFRFEVFGHARSILMHMRLLDGTLGVRELERQRFCPRQIDALFRFRERQLRRLLQIPETDMGCWCPLTSKWCHVDTMIEHANPHLPAGWRFE